MIRKMRKILSALIGALLVAVFLGPVSPAQAAGYRCIGAPADDPGAAGLGTGMYPEPRTFLEAQSWWSDHGTHAHLGACLPADQTVRTGGTVLTAHWRIDMHGMNGYLHRLTQEVATDSCSACGEKATFYNADSTKFRGPGIFWVTTSFDVGTADKTGWQQVQNRFEIKVADGTVRPAIRYMANIQNGKTVDHYNRHDTNGYGWHTNTAYAYARLKSSTSSYSPTLPYAPVKGNYSFIASHETTTDGVSKNITGWMVSVDPKLHADPPSTGLVLGSGTTACAPTVKGTCHGPRNVVWTIDTTQLTDGVHFVTIFTHQKDSSTKENTGVFKYPIIVDNIPG